ncbi:unnamed protein product [Trichobilharzia szidati]|nr:unnamed protein product [Trichobilharzia szidati]
MSKYISISEDWVKEKVKISSENLEDIKTLILQGNYEEKINCLGTALLHFSRLKILDLSRNVLKSIRGIEHIKTLEVLNLYYNSIEDINELRVLAFNKNIKDLDLRLNPVSRLNSDYRLYLTYILPKLKTLDCRLLRDAERKAAISFFGSDPTVDLCPLAMLRKLDDMRISKTNKTRHDHSPHFVEKSDRLLKYYQDSNNNSNNQNNNNSPPNLEMWSNDIHPLHNTPLTYEQDGYDMPSKSQDPWTTNFLRLNPKSRLVPPAVDPPRGVKHAEFYNGKERLQTELEMTVPGRKDRINEKETTVDINGYQPHKDPSERCLSVGPSEVKLSNGPRIPPRGKRFTPSALLSNGCMKKNPAEQVTVESEKYLDSSWMRNELENNLPDKTDQAFFLIMKNFIEEAVSESFARYKLAELKSSLSKFSPSIVNESGVTGISTLPHSSFGRTCSLSDKANFEMKTNGHMSKSENYNTNSNNNQLNDGKNITNSEEFQQDDEKNLEHSKRYHAKRVEVMDSMKEGNELENLKEVSNRLTTKKATKVIQDENVRNKELESENSRLTAEVERLKTRLRLYEEFASAMNSNMAAFHPVIPLSLMNSNELNNGSNSIQLTSGPTVKRAISLIPSNTNSSSYANGLKSENDSTFQEHLSTTMRQAVNFNGSVENQSNSISCSKFMN